MVAFILPANSATGGYEIDNSLRIEDGDSPYLQLAHGADGTTKTMTFSWWFKQGNITINRNFFGHSSVDDAIFIRSDDGFSFIMRNAADGILTTNRKFRDPTAWYHIVLAIDTTQGTAANRIKLYVNGVQETSFATATYPDQNTDLTGFNTNTDNQFIGREKGGNYFDGYMAEVYFIDGVAKAPTDFGEVNDNGVWVPIEYSGSYGTNGYFLEFKQTGTSQNSSGIGADTSGNDNHFAVNNLAATDVTVDTPTNNFATYNSLRPNNQATLSEGNCFVTGVTGGSTSMEYHQLSTILVNKGKWYWEMKITANNTISANTYIGCGYWDDSDSTHGTTVQGCLVVSGTSNVRGGGSYGNTATFQSSLTAPVQNDIYGFAVNCDDEEITFFRNGSAHGSADNDYSALSPEQKLLGPYAGHGGSSQLQNIHLNTGNPAFAISSGNADANGYGNFEFAPPSGYYALCTKNLAEYG